MRIGVNLWTVYGWRPRQAPGLEVLEHLAAMGAEGIELVVDEGLCSAEAWLARQPDLAPRLRDLGLAVPGVASGLFWTYNLASQSPAVRGQALRVVRDQCRVARAFGASVVLVVPGLQEPATDYDATYSTAVQTLRQAALYAEDYGVTIGVENVASNFLQSPREFAALLRDVGSARVRAYLDLGNVLAQRQTYPENWVRALRGQIALVHVKDFDAGDSSLRGFRLCGEGTLDWAAALAALRAAGYDDFLIVETPPEAMEAPGVAAGLRAAEIGVRWLQRALGVRNAEPGRE